ncbi:hypothetical protein ACF0H5_001188 [Mactra antiquata]
MYDGIFPSKYSWKIIIKKAVLDLDKQRRCDHLLTNVSLSPILESIIQVNQPSLLWSVAIQNPVLLKLCKSLIQMVCFWGSRNWISQCNQCNKLTDKIIEHRLLYCTEVEEIRDKLWCYIFTSYSTELYLNLINYSAVDQCVWVIEQAINDLLHKNDKNMAIFVRDLCDLI